MAQLKYVGGGSRTISKADFGKIGVEDQGAARWDEENNYVVEVSDEAAAKLQETHPGQFKTASDADVKAGEGPASDEQEERAVDEGTSETTGRTTGSRTSRRAT